MVPACNKYIKSNHNYIPKYIQSSSHSWLPKLNIVWRPNTNMFIVQINTKNYILEVSYLFLLDWLRKILDKFLHNKPFLNLETVKQNIFLKKCTFLENVLVMSLSRALQSTPFQNPGGGSISMTEDGGGGAEQKPLCLILDGLLNLFWFI